MRAMYILVRSVDETARERISGAILVTGQNATSSRSVGALGARASFAGRGFGVGFGIVVSNRCGPLIGVRSGNPGEKWNAGSTP